ncbi:hypothetical protein L0668_19900 [Paraglaciecola aquimarina]|uniref:Deoxyguanosinetriphosphate triphosphohydrolase n=1 Tax=Paraglaciecola algarum TaxID=3050085 RepID=A0ABS9DBP8_9ALTE|nr:hypothetical protein [Paraglaciecola sp. G1-23]MCF2950383.1 hypothetical protein [Paraglaciecola sp. G1-23]
MASVHAISHQAIPSTALNITLNRSEQLAVEEYSSPQKWTYLLANTIRFSDKQTYCIRLRKPEQSRLHTWVEKIATSGQCSRLFIEQLSIDEMSFKRIKQICTEHNVTLINLLHQADLENNVVQGPW